MTRPDLQPLRAILQQAQRRYLTVRPHGFALNPGERLRPRLEARILGFGSARTLIATPCLHQASQIPLAVWIAPSPLLEAIRFAAGLTTRPPKQTAALLARWPTVPALRPFLRRLTASPLPEQLSLL